MFASNSGQNQVQFFDPTKEQQVKRQRAIAEMLMRQSQQNSGNEMVSGIVVPKSPVEGLSSALQMGLSGLVQGKSNKAEDELNANRRVLMQQAIENMGDPRAAAGILMQDPQSMDMGMRLYMEALGNDRATANKEAEWAREDTRWEKDAALKRELAAMRNSSGATRVDPDTGEIIQGYSEKPLPAAALKMQQEAIDALANAEGIQGKADLINQQLQSGQLKVGPIENVVSGLRNWAGQSSPNSINFQTLETNLEKIRNDSLRLNKGVQTEGDAVRAMNEVIKNKNDPAALYAAMSELRKINERGAELQRLQINNIRSNYNAAPFDFEQMGSLPSGVAQQQAPTGGKADQVRQHLARKGMSPDQIESFIQQRGIR